MIYTSYISYLIIKSKKSISMNYISRQKCAVPKSEILIVQMSFNFIKYDSLWRISWELSWENSTECNIFHSF